VEGTSNYGLGKTARSKLRKLTEPTVLPVMSFAGALKRILPPPTINKLRQGCNSFLYYLDHAFAVDKGNLASALYDLGIRSGDVVYVRSSYDDMRSIRATPMEIIEILAEAVGATGTVVMPTYPMGGLSQAYLDQHPFFDWRRTPSRSGILTEVFRRMAGTERSINPTHPVAARGALAKWLTEGHECSAMPFDEHSPFQKLLQMNASVLSMGRFDSMTLRHFADHLIQDQIPYPIYNERPVRVRVIDKNGNESFIITKAHNPNLGCDHRIVLRHMIREGIVKHAKVGRVPLSLVRVQPYIAAYRRYNSTGLFRHYLKSPQPSLEVS